MAYDPAFAYELAVIVQDGIKRMYVDQENICYYLTVGNEPYAMPTMPKGARDGILKGAYRFGHTGSKKQAAKVKLLGSGAIMHEVVEAQAMLEKNYGVDSESWAVTSYQQMFREALEVQRWNRLHPDKKPKTAHVSRCFGKDPDCLVVCASDYMKALPYSIRDWVAGTFVGLGTDGFGLSEGRSELRDYFEVDCRHIVYATLEALARRGDFEKPQLVQAMKALEIHPDKPYPGNR